jgi:site-specific recombinase XerD
MAKLPKPRFNLKSPKAKTETLIFMVFRYRGKRLLYSTGYSILPADWDFSSQRPTERERRPDLWSIRNLLDDLSSFCKSIYIEANYGAISLDAFKERLDIKTNRITLEAEKPLLSFFEFVEVELAEMKASGMKKGSLSPYKRHAGILKKFAKARGRFDFDDVDWNLRLELIDWLASRNVQLGYGNKTLSIFRQFMERARRKKFHANLKYQGSGWLVTQKKAIGQNVTLSPQELQRLADLQLFGFAQKVRDLFLIGAGTGQRFSDYSKYTPSNFYKTSGGVPLLSVISQKTDTPAKIPLNIFPWLIPVLEKHDYSAPKMSMQKFNETIKDICKKAGLTENILKVEQYMGRKARVEKSYVPKFQEVASHTCRRSFATNLYRMGYKLGQIMPMTGHATEAQLREYIGIDAEENAEEISRSIEQRNQKKD